MVDITNIKRLAKEIEIKYDLNYYEILQDICLKEY